MKRFIMLLGLAILFSGCATTTERQSSIQVEVNKGAPVVYIHPFDAGAYSQASVGVLPFLLPANMDTRLGGGIASLFKDVLLGKEAFPQVRTLSGAYGDLDEAIVIGRKAGVDLVLAGKVNYGLEGTEFGGARLDISLRLLNVNTGKTVWHIGQAMDQPMDYPKTDMMSFLTSSMVPPAIKRPAGAPVVTNMLVQAAVDMSDVVAGARYVRR